MNIEQNFWEHYDFTEYRPPNNGISNSIFEWQNNTYAERLNKLLENNKIDNNNNYYVVEINKYNVKGYYNLKYIKLYFSIIKIEKNCYFNYYIDTPFKKYSFKMRYPRMLACLYTIKQLFFYNIDYFYLYIKNSYEIAQKHNLKCVIKPQSDINECLDKFLSIRFYYTKENYVLFRCTFTQSPYYFDLNNFIPPEHYEDFDEKKHFSTKELLENYSTDNVQFSLYDFIKYHDYHYVENFREIDDSESEYDGSEEEDQEEEDEDEKDSEFDFGEDFTFDVDDVKEVDSEEGDSEEGDSEEGDSEEGDSEEGDSEEGDSEEGDSEEGDSEENKKPNYHNNEEGNYHEVEPLYDPVIFTYVTSDTSISTKKYLTKENKYTSDYFEDFSIQTFMCIPHRFKDLINKMERIVMNEVISHYSKQFNKSKDFQIFSNIIDFL